MALSVENYVHTAISFTYISVSDCDVTCFETETILWNHNECEQHALLAMSHTRSFSVFPEESKRLYTICCATVS